MAAVHSDIENCCVCWTGDEFIFTPLCLYSHIADVLFVSLDDRLRSIDRLAKYNMCYHTIQFYDNLTDVVGPTDGPPGRARNRDYAAEPSQPLLLPLLGTLSGSEREVRTFINDMKSGTISYDTKIWFMKQVVHYTQHFDCGGNMTGEITRAINAPLQGIQCFSYRFPGQSVPADASSPTAIKIKDLLKKTDNDTELFDYLAEILDLQESIKKTLHFDPYILPGTDLRLDRAKEGHFPKYPFELFLAAPTKVMR